MRSDNGGEFVKVHRLCKQLGILSEYSCPHTSEQNGRAERKHRHIVETGLTLLAHGSLPLCYWWDAFQTAAHIINGLPTPTLRGKSPMQILFKKHLNFTDLKVFGCTCFPYLKPYNTHKFNFRTEKCVYLGPSPQHKGHRCLTTTDRIIISRNVAFNELEFPFATGFGQFDTHASPVRHPPILSSTIQTFPSHPILSPIPHTQPSNPPPSPPTSGPPIQTTYTSQPIHISHTPAPQAHQAPSFSPTAVNPISSPHLSSPLSPAPISPYRCPSPPCVDPPPSSSSPIYESSSTSPTLLPSPSSSPVTPPMIFHPNP